MLLCNVCMCCLLSVLARRARTCTCAGSGDGEGQRYLLPAEERAGKRAVGDRGRRRLGQGAGAKSNWTGVRSYNIILVVGPRLHPCSLCFVHGSRTMARTCNTDKLRGSRSPSNPYTSVQCTYTHSLHVFVDAVHPSIICVFSFCSTTVVDRGCFC